MKDTDFINILKEVIKIELNSLKKLQSYIGSSFKKIITTILKSPQTDHEVPRTKIHKYHF